MCKDGRIRVMDDFHPLRVNHYFSQRAMVPCVNIMPIQGIKNATLIAYPCYPHRTRVTMSHNLLLGDTYTRSTFSGHHYTRPAGCSTPSGGFVDVTGGGEPTCKSIRCIGWKKHILSKISASRPMAGHWLQGYYQIAVIRSIGCVLLKG